MSREIKFRAWDKDLKLWCDLTITKDWIGFDLNRNLCDMEHYGKIFTQFTGLLDRNGKEIYEGDIVRQFTFIREVKYSMGMFGYDGMGDVDFIPYGHNYHFNWVNGQSEKIKVIGNIYEHKHLLDTPHKG